jgi:hypothetical protein
MQWIYCGVLIRTVTIPNTLRKTPYLKTTLHPHIWGANGYAYVAGTQVSSRMRSEATLVSMVRRR